VQVIRSTRELLRYFLRRLEQLKLADPELVAQFKALPNVPKKREAPPAYRPKLRKLDEPVPVEVEEAERAIAIRDEAIAAFSAEMEALLGVIGYREEAIKAWRLIAVHTYERYKKLAASRPAGDSSLRKCVDNNA
jgi:hypothetical protein